MGKIYMPLKNTQKDLFGELQKEKSIEIDKLEKLCFKF